MKMSAYAKRRHQRSASGQEIAEFGPALFIFFIIVFFPLLTFFTFLWGVGTCAVVAQVAARDAGTGSTLAQARANMTEACDLLLPAQGGIGSLSGISPPGDSGVTLTVLEVPIQSGDPRVWNPGDPVDTTNNFYEFEVAVTKLISPLFVPQQFTRNFTYAARAHVEHPNGLNN